MRLTPLHALPLCHTLDPNRHGFVRRRGAIAIADVICGLHDKHHNHRHQPTTDYEEQCCMALFLETPILSLAGFELPKAPREKIQQYGTETKQRVCLCVLCK